MKHPISGSIGLNRIETLLGNKLGSELELLGKYPHQVDFTPAYTYRAIDDVRRCAYERHFQLFSLWTLQAQRTRAFEHVCIVLAQSGTQ